MANYNELKEYIDARVIPHNNAQRITGQGLNDSLHEMVDEVNDTKQDTIGDLDDIRTGAEKGATSVQMVNHVRPDADGNVDVQGGGGGTTNYNELDNKPSIAGVTLQGNRTLASLGIASESALAGKQDTISDLASIRSGAAKGETALQSVPSEYVKQSQMTTALAGKQDTISDLATIRSGAGLGATAVQPAALNAKQDVISDLATIRSGASAGATALQPSALNDYYTKTEIDSMIGDVESLLAAI